jgi:hypothetical protein
MARRAEFLHLVDTLAHLLKIDREETLRRVRHCCDRSRAYYTELPRELSDYSYRKKVGRSP